jgi:hypothetical protein
MSAADVVDEKHSLLGCENGDRPIASAPSAEITFPIEFSTKTLYSIAAFTVESFMRSSGEEVSHVRGRE